MNCINFSLNVKNKHPKKHNKATGQFHITPTANSSERLNNSKRFTKIPLNKFYIHVRIECILRSITFMMNRINSKIIIISGPSGVGKGTIIKALLNKIRYLELSVSATTREKRGQEENNKDYYFIKDEEFQQYVDSDSFVEWCIVHSNKYGTLKKEINRINQKNKVVLLEIDIQGAQKVKAKIPEALLIFISPPSIEILSKRLNIRNTESVEQKNKRLEVAKHEIEQSKLYDFVVINDIVKDAIIELIKIIDKRFLEELK